MKKQGFTLIELMVVIVIMGILAAVAVPKLFGMIAKSKASEVGPAAGTYIKLQDAYVSEANKFGSWYLIGYIAPGAKNASESGESTSFKYYAGTNPSIATDAGVALTDFTSATAVWGAVNTAALNDCNLQSNVSAAASANWKIEAKAATNGNSVVYKATVATACKQLTPTFEDISSKAWEN